MPAPTEEQVLTHVLESLDDNSKITKNIKIQKWFLLCVVLAAFAVVFIGYKYACIKTLWLLFAAGICGMALMGLVYMQQVQFQTALLKPYINVSAIQESINAIKEARDQVLQSHIKPNE